MIHDDSFIKSDRYNFNSELQQWTIGSSAAQARIWLEWQSMQIIRPCVNMARRGLAVRLVMLRTGVRQTVLA